MKALTTLQRQILRCTQCPRLVEYRTRVAREKRRQYREWDYWGKPLPSFGDPQARLLIIGLAPAAHGGNRTGRMFTGDQSGDWVYRTLHRFGFANQPTSQHRDDGLTLHDAYITAAAHCVPPDNKPSGAELAACRPYLLRELQLATPCARRRSPGENRLRCLSRRAARAGIAAAGRTSPFRSWRISVAPRGRPLARILPPQSTEYPNRSPDTRRCSRPSLRGYARNWTGTSQSLNRRVRRSILHLDFSPRKSYST